MHALGLASLAAALPAALLALPHDWRLVPLHAGLVASTLALAWRAPAIDGLLAKAPALRWGLVSAGAAALTAVLFWEAPQANWGVIDDHAIHALIGPGQDRLSAGDVFPLLAGHPECGSPTSTQTRYRPAYYAFYLGQAAMFGKDVRPWFMVRLALCTVTAALGFDLLRRWLGMVAGATAVACLAALWMWFDIFGRLGSGETYAAPASAGFVWCVVAILQAGGRSSWLSWTGLAISALIAIGSKENFVILAPLTVMVAVIDRKCGGRSWAGPIVSTIVCVAAALVIAVVAVGIGNNGGRDVYERSVGLAHLFNASDPAARRTLRKLISYGLPLLVGFVLAAVAWARSAGTTAGRQRRIVLATATVLFLVALSQVAFYRGDVFKKCRYDLPLVPIVGILSIGLLDAASRLRQGSASPLAIRHRLLTPGVLAVATLVLGGDHTRAAVRAYVRETNHFFDSVQDIAAACRTDANRPVAFVASSDPTACYEPILSTAAYLRSCGITNPIHLEGEGFAAEQVAAGRSWQARELAGLARSGGGAFQPNDHADGIPDRIEVWFTSDPPPGCDQAFRVHQLGDPTAWR